MAYRMEPSGTPKLSGIDKGAKVCKLIKKVYFADKPWGDCFKEVSTRFTELKSNVRKQHPHLCEVALLDWLCNYDKNDLQDVL
jgi:hypothetical protein